MLETTDIFILIINMKIRKQFILQCQSIKKFNINKFETINFTYSQIYAKFSKVKSFGVILNLILVEFNQDCNYNNNKNTKHVN